MYPLPTSVVDLRLAPVALLVEHRLEHLARLSAAELRLHVALDSDREGVTPQERARDVITASTRLLDLGGWEASWDPRGVRLTHGHHTLVLGAPDVIRDYVAGVSLE